MRSARLILGASAIAAICSLIVACGADEASSTSGRSGIEFGIWVPDAAGELRFVETSEVPCLDEQAFGWRVPTAPARHEKWVETLKLPAAPRSWEGVAEDPNVLVSADGRSATTLGESLPGEPFIGHVWYVSDGDPAGDYEMSVELEDGRTASFRFRLVSPRNGRCAAADGEVI
jgi:hypothetical protein